MRIHAWYEPMLLLASLAFTEWPYDQAGLKLNGLTVEALHELRYDA
jgi:hypothetical protein